MVCLTMFSFIRAEGNFSVFRTYLIFCPYLCFRPQGSFFLAKCVENLNFWPKNMESYWALYFFSTLWSFIFGDFLKKKADWRLDQSLPWVFLVSRKNGFYTYLRLLFRPLFSCSRQSLFFLLSSLLLLVSLLHTSWSVTAQENSHF